MNKFIAQLGKGVINELNERMIASNKSTKRRNDECTKRQKDQGVNEWELMNGRVTFFRRTAKTIRKIWRFSSSPKPRFPLCHMLAV